MTSTYLGYELYARNLGQSLTRVDDEAANKRDKAYYDANIGKVKSVDDFIGNYRLFSYAMKAYGLEDVTYAKGLMRKVLTSDLTDPQSVANRFSDSRYKAFAKAFAFTTTGAVVPTSVQSERQQSATVTGFQSRMAGTLSSTQISDATDYYQSHIGGITSLDALEKDNRLLAYVETAYGLDTTMSTDSFTTLVEGGLADPKSLVNTSGAGYTALNGAFNVSSTGGPSTKKTGAQTHDAILAASQAYVAAAPQNTTGIATAKAEADYYNTAIANVTSVDDVMKDNRLVAFIISAFGLPSDTSGTLLRQVLTSDASDPKSLANQLTNPAYAAVTKAFNFATDGSLKPLPLQTDDQVRDTVALFTARHTSDSAAMDAATAYYRSHIGAIKTVAALEADTQLLAYVKTAYGVTTETDAAIADVLEADSASPSGVLTTTAASYLAAASAFSVDAQGQATDVLQAQGAQALSATTAAYMATVKPDGPSQVAAKAETDYYTGLVGKAASVDELLGDDRAVAYIRKAYGLASVTPDALRQILTQTAPASMMNDAAKAAALAFNFGANGLLAHGPVQQAQSDIDRLATEKLYTRVAMEGEAGADNEGVRLALYFQRLAPTITTPYQILADKALVQVAQTILGLSPNSSKADVDVQARTLSSRFNFADFKNPAKLDALVRRFATLYDMANGTGQSDTIAMLFGGSGSGS